MLAQTGWALFVDCDVVFRGSPLAMPLDDSKAVMVVKHRPLPAEGTKMDGQAQQAYSRKNWSSVIAFNCDHPANRRPHGGDLPGHRHGVGRQRDVQVV